MRQISSLSVKKYIKTLSRVLKSNRERSGFSLSGVCSRAVKISLEELTRFEEGKAVPTLRQLYELVQVYQQHLTAHEENLFFSYPEVYKSALVLQERGQLQQE